MSFHWVMTQMRIVVEILSLTVTWLNLRRDALCQFFGIGEHRETRIYCIRV